MITKDQILQALRGLIDPELGINVVDLGLIYDVRMTEELVFVTMTLTTMGCPLGPWFLENVKKTVGEGVGISQDKVEVEITFDPPWTRDMMNEDAIAELGLD
jgi:metal-sulfur cluster biosynthetic enzyme